MSEIPHTSRKEDVKLLPAILCQICSCYSNSMEIDISINSQELCQHCLDNDQKQLVEYPPPFESATKIEFDIIIIPSKGTFIHHYTKGSKLHIGLLKDDHRVWNFDQGGLKCSSPTEARWQQCLCLEFMKNIDKSEEISKDILRKHWVSACQVECNQRLSNEDYDCDYNNCFDFVIQFVITFLNLIANDNSVKVIFRSRMKTLADSLADKETFCKEFVIPRTKIAAKYIGLYRKLKIKQN